MNYLCDKYIKQCEVISSSVSHNAPSSNIINPNITHTNINDKYNCKIFPFHELQHLRNRTYDKSVTNIHLKSARGQGLRGSKFTACDNR